ncbi:TetR/AcrR family transcriptional regulator [Roseateles puraquae]|jgi:AcrR family transcriptional regulator|uniref:TetR/AcrR family transcriptional regulator n=1 Tax=Roseateles puraquae TaxID=431059 RepID=UPI0031DE5455
MPAPRPPSAAVDAPLPPRERLLLEAMRLFGERGVDAVPTREICAAAGVNPGAIHYHFGDKDGLYAEVLRQPVQELKAQLEGFDDPALSLHESICRFLRPFLFEDDGCHGLLFFREMQAPSAVFMQTVAQEVGPLFDRFARLLARHAGLDEPTPALHQLAMGLQTMAHDYSMSRPLLNAFHPELLADDPQLEKTCVRLADWGCALVAYERERHAQPR